MADSKSRSCRQSSLVPEIFRAYPRYMGGILHSAMPSKNSLPMDRTEHPLFFGYKIQLGIPTSCKENLAQRVHSPKAARAVKYEKSLR